MINISIYYTVVHLYDRLVFFSDLSMYKYVFSREGIFGLLINMSVYTPQDVGYLFLSKAKKETFYKRVGRFFVYL